MQLGMSSTSQWLKKYSDRFEVAAEEYSKELFKMLKLYHWSATSKMILTLAIMLFPLLFIIVGSFTVFIIFTYNKVALYFYEKKVDKLEA